MNNKEDLNIPGKFDVMKVFQEEIKKAEKTLEKIDKIYRKDISYFDYLSDRIAEIGGSWGFIFIFLMFIFSWMIINSWILIIKPFDPHPYILLNLILSTLAAIQAPIILMSQSRAAKRDQIRAELDLEKDLRDLHIDQHSHQILLELQRDMKELKKKMEMK